MIVRADCGIGLFEKIVRADSGGELWRRIVREDCEGKRIVRADCGRGLSETCLYNESRQRMDQRQHSGTIRGLGGHIILPDPVLAHCALETGRE